ncbi:RHS repeat-associated core domain-containing protein [Escherichia coli]|uniref:RHS repeat-associated core domain-containing protein n=1 Tax=Escherichia coli TaxID=562 RepID=UPI000BE97421|nr:RHS repeat-associated core domain-containing protein [Escherichia coli]
MSGKPAARQGDMTQYGGPIVQGSAGVRIGAPTGVACSVCPGGMTSGNPVNPLLGAKVLPGETDLALPGPLPFILSRTYSSYRTRTPAPVGVFGPGWKAPSDIRLQLRDDALVLNDNGGRSIHFEPLLPGEAVYSRSESMWLVRGGKAAQPDGHTLARLWGALPPDIRLSPHLYLATNSAQGPWWIYEPGSFTPLIRVETENGEREKAQRRSLAETLQQEGSENGHGVVFPAELVRLLDRLEEEIRADRVSSESRAWLAQCGLTVEQLARQVEPEYTPARKVHFYHCDHRGLPLALISEDGNTAWRGEYDEWGNQLNEENPHHLHQPYRLPGQQHDEESGLYYNRHRHYDPLQGRYITPDPIGLRGGWNMYQYPLNPIQVIDPMGLDAIENMTSGGLIYAVSGVPGLIAANSITNSAYQFGYDMDAIVGGAHNGAADAMRHCYLMCRMTKTFGSTIADVIGKNHEAAGDRQGQPAKERIMDLKNNTVGIACGDFSAKCSDACIEKYNTGQLFGLDGIKADNPIKAKQGSSDASNY